MAICVETDPDSLWGGTDMAVYLSTSLSIMDPGARHDIYFLVSIKGVVLWVLFWELLN